MAIGGRYSVQVSGELRTRGRYRYYGQACDAADRVKGDVVDMADGWSVVYLSSGSVKERTDGASEKAVRKQPLNSTAKRGRRRGGHP
jgi:hypothetical protein